MMNKVKLNTQNQYDNTRMNTKPVKEMDTSLEINRNYRTRLDAFRSGAFAKSVAGTTLALFTWVFCLSTPAYVIAQETTRAEQNEARYDELMERTRDPLSYRMEKLQKKLRDMDEEAQNPGAFARFSSAIGFSKPVSNSQQQELAVLKVQIEAAFETVEAQLDETAAKLSDMSPAMQARHAQAKQTMMEQYNALMSQLDMAANSTDEQEQQTALDALRSQLENQSFKRRADKFDPEAPLPFGARKGQNQQPAMDEQALNQIMWGDDYQFVQAMPHGPVEALNTQGGPTQDDLNATLDAQITPAIEAKALELNYDPVEIYNWVRNNIEFLPSYGSIQGAAHTLETGRGNAFDTSSLLISLLRASNIPARYRYGTVFVDADRINNWVGGTETILAASNLFDQGGIPNSLTVSGGQYTGMAFEHIWVEAWVDFYPSRGAKHNQGDSWVALDPSFKQYEYTQGFDLEQNLPFDAEQLVSDIEAAATIDETTGSVSGIDQALIEQSLNDYQVQLEDYINNQNPDATVGEVLGTQKIIIQERQELTVGLPYRLLAKSDQYATLPDTLRVKFRYQLSQSIQGLEGTRLIDLEEPTVSLAGKKIALSFSPASQEDQDLIESFLPDPDPVTGEIDPNQLLDTLPGYLINLTAEVTLDDNEYASVPAGTMGTELYENSAIFRPFFGWENNVNYPIAGEYHAIALNLQGVSAQEAERLQSELEDTQEILESGSDAQIASLAKQDVVGDLLYTTIYTYFALNDAQDQTTAQRVNHISYRSPSYGKFATKITPIYWFGIPRNVVYSGLNTDVDLLTIQSIKKQNNIENLVGFNRAVGSRYSVAEHLVPEQMFSTSTAQVNAISAVKAISLATQQGQKIYTIRSSNIDTVLSEIAMPEEIENRIRQAVVFQGMEATIHETPLDFFGNASIGYTLIDPETGAGAYIIAGGSNGADIVGGVLTLWGGLLFVLEAGLTKSLELASLFY